MTIRAVCFDAFGTVIQRGERHRPYRLLRTPISADDLMSRNVTIEQLFEERGQVADVAEAVARVQAECASCTLYPEVSEVIATLKSRGIKVALCSNLAHPYGSVIHRLLPGLDAAVLSYEVGAIKPQPKIYQAVCVSLGLDAGQVFFTGDSADCDRDGPMAFGMQAAWLDRASGQTLWDVLPKELFERKIRS